MIKAGFSQTVITPPVGAEMPGSMNKRFAQNIHDQLYAKAMVLDDGNTQIALVGVDALSVKRSTVLAARKQIDAETDMPGENVMVAASHTHNGGPTADCFLSESDPSYCTFVAQQIATAVIDAHRKKQEVRLIIGAGHEDSVAFNRRFKMKDGTERTHPGKLNPDIVELAGPIDPMVGVIGAVDENCKLLGCWVNYTCHCTLGVGGAGFSADYPYYLTKVIQRAMNAEDAVVVFGNGACGDVTQVDNQRDRGREFGEEWGWHVGATIGAEALKVLARLEYTDDVKLASDKQILKLSLRDIPEEEFQKAKEIYAAHEGDKWTGEEVYAYELVLLEKIKEAEPQVDAEIQMFQVGNAAIVSVPAEYFCQFGLDIKAASKFKPAFVVELANGCVGYVPTRQALLGGGYEPRTARSSKLEPGAGEKIANAAIELLNE